LSTPTWVEHPDLVDYYASHRGRPDELYPSEERFLPELARSADSVLDVGCGAGGFAAIWRHFNPRLSYTGVDASEALVEAGRRLHPDAVFLVADGAQPLPVPDRCADVVAALGWLHLEPRWRDALPELWRAAGRYLFFDMRLHPGDGELEGRQRLALAGEWDGHTTIPYLAASWSEVTARLTGLAPAAIRAYGYEGAPADTVSGMSTVCFATFVLERGEGASGIEVESELPYPWPDGATTS
jgi:SAM-dependent methyltransferase